MTLVEARVLCPGDVVVTSDGARMLIRCCRRQKNRVRLRLKMMSRAYGEGRVHEPFTVPLSTRLLREDS